MHIDFISLSLYTHIELHVLIPYEAATGFTGIFYFIGLHVNTMRNKYSIFFMFNHLRKRMSMLAFKCGILMEVILPSYA